MQKIILRIIVLITLAIFGFLLPSLTLHFLLMIGLVPAQTIGGVFLQDFTEATVYAWLISLVLGIISLFIKQKWRYVLLICPLIAPSLFAVIYTLNY